LHRVTDRVYIFRNIVNSAVVFGDEAIAVVDTQVNDALAGCLLAQIRQVSEKPIRYAINTHYHWDHTGGNEVFKRAGAEVISSTRTKTFMQERTQRQKAFLESRGFALGPDPYLADMTVSEPHDLDLGNQRLCLQHLGAAETDDALAIHLPQERCVLAGDTVMTGSFPIFGQPVMDEGLMGTSTWLETIAHIERLQPDHVLPGHGPVAYEQELDLLKRIQHYFLEEVAVRVERGMPLPQLLADLEGQLPAWVTALPVVWGTPRYAILRVYRGLTRVADDEWGWQHFKPSAIPGGDEAKVEAVCASLTAVAAFEPIIHEFEEGGDVGSAIAAARRATAVAPEDPGAWVLRADVLIRGSRVVPSVLEKGDYFAEAQQALQQALRLDAQYAPAHVTLGQFLVMRAYRNGDDPAEGMAHLRQVMARLPVDVQGADRAWLARAHFYMGMGFRTQGDERQARVHFQTALGILPHFGPALLALKA
jgi:glyoxylase-like metal-dependent hydrolase (beta-lactamase superfamily II)